jgi:hypothetical protein
MLLDGEKLNADLHLENLDNYTWDLKVKGGIDLEKMTKVFPIKDMTLAGKVKADIKTSGKYSDVKAEKYDRLPTSGTASLTDFKYITKDLPQVTLSQAAMVFDPKKIDLQKLNGTVGKSDFNVTGSVLNYLGYLFGKNETIKGNVNFNSNLFDLNEFMTGDETTDKNDTSSFGVVPVPQNVDFLLNSNIKTVKLMDFTLTNASGDIVVKDGVANLRGLKFDMLGGSFGVDGIYSTRDLSHPKYDLALKIQNVSMKEAASASTIVQTYAPIAGLVNGKFSTDFKLNGELAKTGLPNLATVNGGGLIKIAQAALTQSKLISGITSITKLSDTDQVTLKDVLMSASLKDGKLSVQPFDVKFGDYKTTVAGATNLDGTIDYTLKMDVPAGKLGTEFNSFVSRYGGNKNDPNAPIPLTIGVGGKYSSPVTKLVMDSQKEQAKEAVVNAAKEEGTKALQKAVKGTEAEKVLDNILGTKKKDSASTATAPNPADTAKSTQVTEEDVKQKVEDEAKKKIQNLLKRKKN